MLCGSAHSALTHRRAPHTLEHSLLKMLHSVLLAFDAVPCCARSLQRQQGTCVSAAANTHRSAILVASTRQALQPAGPWLQVLADAGYSVAVEPREASTQGLVRELALRGEAAGARVLCPVPLVTGAEPPFFFSFFSQQFHHNQRPTRCFGRNRCQCCKVLRRKCKHLFTLISAEHQPNMYRHFLHHAERCDSNDDGQSASSRPR